MTTNNRGNKEIEEKEAAQLFGTWQYDSSDQMIDTFEINDNGTYTQYNTKANESTADTSLVLKGTYTIDGNQISLKTYTFEGKTEAEFSQEELAEEPSIKELFTQRTYTYKVEGNKLILTDTSNGVASTLTKVNNE